MEPLTDQSNINAVAVTEEKTIEVIEPSIFNLETFPANKHKAYSVIVPRQWLAACTLFENGETIRKACTKVGIVDAATYYHALNDFPELYNKHAAAKVLRSHQWADDTVDIAEAVATDPEATMAKVRATEAVIKARQWVIERHNRLDYGDNKTLNVNQRALNVSIALPAGTDISADALMAAIQSQSK